jgi:signal transduction histidine kinase
LPDRTARVAAALAVVATAGLGAAFLWNGPARQTLLLLGGLLALAAAAVIWYALSVTLTQLDQRQQQLEKLQAELQRLEATTVDRAAHFAVLSDLASGLAHEIFNPLAGIAGVLEISARDLGPGSAVREVLLEVQKEVQRIKKILSDLGDFARVRPPDLQPGDLKETVEHAVALARVQAAVQAAELELSADPALPPVRHDGAQIQQLTLLLLRNALQALEGAGKVKVEIGARDGFAVLSVSDTGCGIPPEKLSAVFRPFVRFRGQGSGLGLAIARRISEAHGGRLQAASTPGEGSTFSVWLPIGK